MSEVANTKYRNHWVRPEETTLDTGGQKYTIYVIVTFDTSEK